MLNNADKMIPLLMLCEIHNVKKPDPGVRCHFCCWDTDPQPRASETKAWERWLNTKTPWTCAMGVKWADVDERNCPHFELSADAVQDWIEDGQARR